MERGQEEDGKEAQELLSLDLALEISGEVWRIPAQLPLVVLTTRERVRD